VTSLTTLPSIFVTGGSGFVGRALTGCAERPLRVLAHTTPVEGQHEVVHGDLLDPSSPWSTWLEGMTRLVHAARPSAGTDRGRRRIAKRTAVANEAMLSAAQMHGLHTLAVHGSLSYGDCGETIVTPASAVNPIGYAQAYAIGEAPWRSRVGAGCTIVRAPWIMSSGSWFSMLYASATVPCFGDGSMWMSIVDLERFASWFWSMLDEHPGGVVHPPLLVRCRQRDFAERVAHARGVNIEAWSLPRTRRAYGKQAAASIFASLRMDDGQGDAPEGPVGMQGLERVLQSVVGRS
jgi:nucleoside-diphosphate-sugar epimerase